MNESIIHKIMENFKKNGFTPCFAETAVSARQRILDMVPLQATIGAGDSASLRQIGILDAFAERGQPVITAMTRELTLDPTKHHLMHATSRRSLNSDVFLTGCNAVTLDGKLVNIDRVGNRIAGMIFGAPKVIVVAGQNKIVPTVEEALYRIKHIIAPAHASFKGRRTPCAATGNCNDCDSPDRICRITLIVEKKPQFTEMIVILVGEDLGLGWDPGWDSGRIKEISTRYEEVSWRWTPSHT